MGLFSRKEKMNVVEFTRKFYDQCILGGEEFGFDMASVMANRWKKIICNADASFEEVSSKKFTEELIPIELETIGIAWGHELNNVEVSIAISEFTKKYLTDMGRSDWWDKMLEYNQLVAHSPISYVEAEKVPEEEVKKLNDFMKTMRAGLYSQWAVDGRDKYAVARTINRYGSEQSWNAGFTPLFLAAHLNECLGIECSPTIVDQLSVVIDGLYQGGKEVLEGVKLTL